MEVSFWIAFSAGLLSFFSPCVLPLIPSYITLLVGDYAESARKKAVIIPALVFIASFTLVFVVLGLSASLLGQFLLSHLNILKKLSGIAIIILGLHLSGILKLKFLYSEKRMDIKTSNKFLRPLIMGVALALAWTPCIGPILSSILVYAASQATIQAGILLVLYSAGFAIPFIITALFMDMILPYLKKLNPYLPVIQKAAGVLLIILGILIFTNYFQVLIYY
ncbi:MAG: cytochrome c biogenesis CcdA family protein [bacterium]